MQITDAIMEKPTVFRVEGRVFYIYPMTLGKMLFIQRIMEGMALDVKKGRMDVEILRVVKENRDACCDLIAYMTARNEYYAVFDQDAFEDRRGLISRQDDGDIASLLMIILTADKMDSFMKHLGIDIEQKNMKKVMKVKEKSDKNSFTFGGVSIYGSFIDAAMERYALTKRQVVWEVDYTSLRLLLADRPNSVYVTDEERKKIHIPKDRTRVSGDDKAAMKKIIESQSWE